MNSDMGLLTPSDAANPTSAPVSATSVAQAPVSATSVAQATVDIVIPVFNEARNLPTSVDRLCDYLDRFPLATTVTIADNGSTDDTLAVATRLAAIYERVRVVHLSAKGRGRALRRVWSHSEATVVAYMDVDLSTDLDALLPLIAPLVTGHSDLAIGTRLGQGAQVARGAKREFISRSYNAMLRAVLGVRFSDAQCGFKAVRADRVRELLPLIADEEWFFDTELLVVAERAGLRIHEIPVDWVDDPDSRVNIPTTVWADLKGMARLARGLMTGAIPLDAVSAPPRVAADRHAHLLGQILRFAVVGVISTVVFSLLFVVFRSWLPVMSAATVSLLLATVLNTAFNRRVTFGVRGRRSWIRHQLQGLLLLGMALVLTNGALWMLHQVVVEPSRMSEVVVLTAANLAATIARFLLLRGWVFRGQRSAS